MSLTGCYTEDGPPNNVVLCLLLLLLFDVFLANFFPLPLGQEPRVALRVPIG